MSQQEEFDIKCTMIKIQKRLHLLIGVNFLLSLFCKLTMTKKERLFHDAFLQKGGIYLPQWSNYVKGLTSILRLGKKVLASLQVTYTNLPNINFGFINNTSFNASVRKYNEEYFVGINIGVFFKTFDLYFVVFSNQDVLSHMGNSKNENHRAFFETIANFSKPNDETRLNYAFLFTAIALRHLILHECGHIVHGHVEYLEVTHSNFYWNEFVSRDKMQKEDRAFFQTLEMDADYFATLRTFMDVSPKINRHAPLAENFPDFNDWNSFVEYWGLAVYLFFKFMGSDNFTIEEAKEMSHPPPSIRMSLITMNFLDYFSASDDMEFLVSVTQTLMKSCSEADKIYSLITNNKIPESRNFNMSYSDPELIDYKTSIQFNWNQVRVILEPYAYGILRPPIV